METPCEQLTKRAAGGTRWRGALRRLLPRPRRPAEDEGGAFDHLARSLAEEVLRREAMRRLGGGLAAAMLASLGLETAWGDPGGPNGPKPRCKKGFFLCPDGHCCPIGNACCGSLCCPSGSPCCGGACCQLGQSCCVGPGPSYTPHCATIGSSTDCSACNDVCESDETCLGAQCVCGGNHQPRCEADFNGLKMCCPAGEKCCGSSCVEKIRICCYSAVVPGIGATTTACLPSEPCCLGPATADPLDRNVQCCPDGTTCCPSGDCVPTGMPCP